MPIIKKIIVFIKQILAHWIRIAWILAWVRKSYLSNVTQAVKCGLFVGCIGTRVHSHKVTSIVRQSDVIMYRDVIMHETIDISQ